MRRTPTMAAARTGSSPTPPAAAACPRKSPRASGEVDGVRLPKEAYYVCQAMFRDRSASPHHRPLELPGGHEEDGLRRLQRRGRRVVRERQIARQGQATDAICSRSPTSLSKPGEIKAVAYTGGKQSPTQAKHTVGAPVALKMTPITGPGGLRADGSDVALIDVEAVDAKGERCPTFQQRVDFDTSGPAIWRGGYNSGKTNSINNTVPRSGMRHQSRRGPLDARGRRRSPFMPRARDSRTRV